MFLKIRLSIVFILSMFTGVSSAQFGLTTTFTTPQASVPSTALPNCLEYCFVGVCTYITCRLGLCRVRTTPRVSHRLPDFIVSAYEHPGEITWLEARLLYGLVSRLSLQAVVASTTLIPFVGGGRDTNTEFSGQDNDRDTISSSLTFKEASVVGNPFLSIWEQFMDGDPDNNSQTTEEGICTTYVEPFQPYYQSEVNGFNWRYIGTELLYPATYLPGFREIGNLSFFSLPTTWGSVHPRHGFLYQEEDKKAAAVMAQRAIDIVTRQNQPHLYRYSPSVERSDENTDRWADVFPRAALTCVTFGKVDGYATGFNANDASGNYGWVYWGRHECCINMRGVIISVMEIEPVCAASSS